MTEPPKANITTTVELPGQAINIYETSVSIPPGEQITHKGLISLLTGHLSVLTEELNTLKDTK